VWPSHVVSSPTTCDGHMRILPHMRRESVIGVTRGALAWWRAMGAARCRVCDVVCLNDKLASHVIVSTDCWHSSLNLKSTNRRIRKQKKNQITKPSIELGLQMHLSSVEDALRCQQQAASGSQHFRGKDWKAKGVLICFT
jgi:hypothetical protein